MKNVRITITLDKDSYKKIEDEKERKNVARSSLIQQIIQYYFDRKKEEEDINRYIKGYQEIPEKVDKVAEWEDKQYKILDKEF
ncbi:MAG: hypothetical protein GX240_04810 [Candidatus Atribacteria bacterium]|nr:hypothetical protein [Candidatus Atribacteria bacterium]